MTMSERRRTCPDCDAGLEPVKLIGAKDPGRDRKGVAHVELTYAAPDARASFFLRRIPRLGTVKGVICPACVRLVLYGEPRSP
jgi:hypothetical protein